ncbi:MAG: hypothetical protein ACKVTZ_07340 [Bacteroidia bacterium]
MQRITIEIEQNSDFQLLLLLAQRIGLRIVQPFMPKSDIKERERHLQIIAKGGNTSYIENPMEWQREQRKDRNLPFRD